MSLHVKYGLVLAAAAALVAHPWPVSAQQESAEALVRRMLDNAPQTSFQSRVKLSSDRGWLREMEMKHKNTGGTDATYIEVTGPQDVRNTRFLFLERADGKDEQYIRVPALKRVIRVANETRKQPFLGSDFYVSDLVAPSPDDYAYEYVGEEEIDGRKCKLVESTPKNAEAELYAKTISAIDPKDLVVLRTQFFDRKGELLKVWTVDKLEKKDGVWTPMVQKMGNVQSNTHSTMEVTDIQYNVELPDNLFSRGYLTQ